MNDPEKQEPRASNVIPFPVKKRVQVYVTESVYKADLVKALEAEKFDVITTLPAQSDSEIEARILKEILARADKLGW